VNLTILLGLVAITGVLTAAAAAVIIAATGAVMTIRDAIRRRRDWAAAGRRAEEQLINLGCRHCDDEPGKPCTCVGDCGRRNCAWPIWNTLCRSEGFRRNLAELVRATEGGDL
jgi:hypothetical protein